MRRVDAMARWYRSNVSPSRVSGHSRRWVMYTSTENTPTSSVPFSAAWPPMIRVSVKATRIAMRMRGMNADDSVIARRLASR
jgi:hypothetical protein